MKILSTISIHYPAKGKREYPNLSGRSCYLDLIPNSSHLFTRNCVKAGGENYNQILGVKGLKHYFGNWDWGDYPECQHNSFSLCFNWQEEHLMVKSLTKVSAQLQLIQFSFFFFFFTIKSYANLLQLSNKHHSDFCYWLLSFLTSFKQRLCEELSLDLFYQINVLYY